MLPPFHPTQLLSFTVDLSPPYSTIKKSLRRRVSGSLQKGSISPQRIPWLPLLSASTAAASYLLSRSLPLFHLRNRHGRVAPYRLVIASGSTQQILVIVSGRVEPMKHLSKIDEWVQELNGGEKMALILKRVWPVIYSAHNILWDSGDSSNTLGARVSCI